MEQPSLCTTTSEPSTQIPPFGSRLSWVHRNWMPLPATAHFALYLVFIAFTILCYFLRLVCLSPFTAAHPSIYLCSPQTVHILSRLSILNVWLLDYTFLDFYASISCSRAPEPQLLNLHAITTEALTPRVWAPQQEKPLQWETSAPQQKAGPARCN